MIGYTALFLTIEVSDGEYTDSYTLRVDIEDVNEAPEFQVVLVIALVLMRT